MQTILFEMIFMDIFKGIYSDCSFKFKGEANCLRIMKTLPDKRIGFRVISAGSMK